MLPEIKDRDLVFVDVGHKHFSAPGIYVIDIASRLVIKKAMAQTDVKIINPQ